MPQGGMGGQPEATAGVYELGPMYRPSGDSAERGRWGRRWGPRQTLDLGPPWWTRCAAMSQWAGHHPFRKAPWGIGGAGCCPMDLGPGALLGLGFVILTQRSPGSTLGHLGAGDGSVLLVTLRE